MTTHSTLLTYSSRESINKPCRKSIYGMRRAGRRRRDLFGEDLELVDDFGEVVRRARAGLGLTQEELAKQVGEKLTVIKKIEAGEFKPPISLARKLERILRVRLLIPTEEPLQDLAGRYLKKVGREAGGISLGDLLKKREAE